jgi:iduronate 2-sulfatase
MRRRDPSRPYLLRLSFNAPHTPVVTPAPFDTLIEADCIDLPLEMGDEIAYASDTHRDFLCANAGTQRLTRAQVQRARQCYYGYVACVDHVFGRLLDALEERGELENTIVAYVSDHGAHLGDHGFFQKQSFWEPSARVPFFFTGPGIRQAEAAVPAPVNAGSLLPTLLELVDLPVPAFVQYPSLARTLQAGEPVVPGPVFSEIDLGLWHYRPGERQVMVRSGRWKAILYRDPRDPDRFAGREDRLLYDLVADPHERQNLACDPAYAQVMEMLVSEIDNWDRTRPVVESSLIAGRASR